MRSSLNAAASLLLDALAPNGNGMRHSSEHKYCLKAAHDIWPRVTVRNFSKKCQIDQLATPLIKSTCAGSKYACVTGLTKLRSDLQLSSESLSYVRPKAVCIFSSRALVTVSEAWPSAS